MGANGRVDMWKDEVLGEIYKIREEHAQFFNYDLKAICDELFQREAISGRKLISTPLKQLKQKHNKSFQPNV